MVSTEKTTTVKLVDGEFTISEARDIITALIDQKINFHKVQRLSIWEGNENQGAEFPNGRIVELARDKQAAKQFLAQVKDLGQNVRISGTLELTVGE